MVDRKFYCLIFLCSIIFFTPSVVKAESNELSFGIPPYANPAVVYEDFNPLVAYLSESIGKPIRIVIARNYIDHVMKLGSGEVDMGFVGPSPYVKVKDKFGGIELLARMRMEGEINDRMVIIAHRDSGIDSISELRGKTFAFGDHQSFGSHFLPRYVLNNNGIELKDLKAYDYVKSHDNVALSVLHGDFDAGGIREDIYIKYRNRPLKVIEGPISIQPHVIVCRSALGAELKKRLRAALVALEDKSILKALNPAMEGFYPVEDGEFDRAREVIEFIESR
jgi:phosphonate transport system substrate-binding protein